MNGTSRRRHWDMLRLLTAFHCLICDVRGSRRLVDLYTVPQISEVGDRSSYLAFHMSWVHTNAWRTRYSGCSSILEDPDLWRSAYIHASLGKDGTMHQMVKYDPQWSYPADIGDELHIPYAGTAAENRCSDSVPVQQTGPRSLEKGALN